MDDKIKLDWSAIEYEYRAGATTVQSIADKYGITKGAIGNRAKRFDWSRDLTARIKAKKEELVNNRLVNDSVNKHSEAAIIRTVAKKQAEYTIEEKAHLEKLERLAAKHAAELDTSADDLEKKIRMTKQHVETVDKLFNLMRRNLGINDNANGNADQKEDHGALLLAAAIDKCNSRGLQ
jgi:hypothetical protein